MTLYTTPAIMFHLNMLNAETDRKEDLCVSPCVVIVYDSTKPEESYIGRSAAFLAAESSLFLE